MTELTADDIAFGPLSQPAAEATHSLLHRGEPFRTSAAISIHGALAQWRSAAIREEHTPRLRIGIPRVDRATRGLQPGELLGILARTGSGKTLLTMAIVDEMVRQRPDAAVLVCNLEMPLRATDRPHAADALPPYGRCARSRSAD
jgi:predicted ATP-dependent serine protease